MNYILKDLLAEELEIQANSIEKTLLLLEDGATVPFIARYRKEVTGNLDETEIRKIQERGEYYRDLEQRKETILKSIEEQGKLTPELENNIKACKVKQELEDLYLPFKPKRRTKASIAKEQGLLPLAEIIWNQDVEKGNPLTIAASYLNPEKGVDTAEKALDGAGYILAERISEDANLRKFIRDLTLEKGIFVSVVKKEYAGKKTKFDMYYDFHEQIAKIPSHRMLALRRGENEGVLGLSVEFPVQEIMEKLRKSVIRNQRSIFRDFLLNVIDDAFSRLISQSIEVEIRMLSKQGADAGAIEVFENNLRALLLHPPAGERVVMGVDPGLRTGSKVAVIDGTGKFLECETIYPLEPWNKVQEAEKILEKFIKKYRIQLIAIGNGTGSREMDRFVSAFLKSRGGEEPKKLVVSEAGASVYSASEIARDELPGLDVSVRGAVSIARRLQDPLAELVKIDPKSIGVGQYQHDVEQVLLRQKLENVVESCVNYVGVDVNTASPALLKYVSGIGSSVAKNIVEYREKTGKFDSRKRLREVPRFGAKVFEQAAGFLRIRDSIYPLDNSAVHPERYELVETIATDLRIQLKDLIGNQEKIQKIDVKKYVSQDAGLPTLQDIIDELMKPGRDPRKDFTGVEFNESVTTMDDLKQGMVLTGVVTNVTNFGAFVDIGVHQDGLVHVSELSNKFIKDPNSFVKIGEVVKVKVLSVDIERKRIGLSMKEVSRK